MAHVWWALGLAGLFVGACGGASPSSGVGAIMMATGAQLIEGPIDVTASATAPAVRTFDTKNFHVSPGVQNKGLSGTVGPGGVSVLFGVQGDSVHWVVGAQAFDTSQPDERDFSMKVSFSDFVPPGPLPVVLRAVAANGDVGPPTIEMFTVDDSPLVGTLVFILEWDTEADLDLHVVAPGSDNNPSEIWWRHRTSLNPPAPGDPALTAAQIAALPLGQLDVDSNGQCVIDGRRREVVSWQLPPPSGTYIARVDTPSLCGAAFAQWHLSVVLNGAVIGSVLGRSGDADTRFNHGAGAGVTAWQQQL